MGRRVNRGHDRARDVGGGSPAIHRAAVRRWIAKDRSAQDVFRLAGVRSRKSEFRIRSFSLTLICALNRRDECEGDRN